MEKAISQEIKSAPLGSLFWKKRDSTAEQPSRSLVMPGADFWLVGGSSLATLLIFWVLSDGVFHLNLDAVPGWAYYGAFAVNFPHFLFSYELFYPGLMKRLRSADTTPFSKFRLITSGFLVPALMVAYFIFAWFARDPKYLGWAAFAMIFSVGWHYVKQAYGVFITLSLYKNIFYGIWGKRILQANAYVVWMYTWARTNRYVYEQHYYDVSYMTFGYPPWIEHSLLIGMWIMTLASAVVLLTNKKGVSLSAVTGYAVGLYLWMVLPFGNMAFYVFVPFFHSLQYFPFVYKFKKSQFIEARAKPENTVPENRRRVAFWLGAFVFGGYALGALAFVIVPMFLDSHFWVPDLDKQFFIVAFPVFINIHHFFIDNAFWRRDNTDVQKYLFRA